MSDEVIERTLFICSEIHIYRIPPRPAAGGYRSGEWKTADEIFKGRLRFVSLGQEAEIRFEDIQSSELFALVPVSLENRHLVVESAMDSSRNFVVRVEDPETGAHAFLGLGFETRDSAFDFMAALEDNERQISRQSSTNESNSEMIPPELAALHKPVADLGLKEGQTIQVKIKNKVAAPKKSSNSQGTAAKRTTPKILAPPSGPTVKNESQQKQDTNWARFE
eukprot:g7183.t1